MISRIVLLLFVISWSTFYPGYAQDISCEDRYQKGLDAGQSHFLVIHRLSRAALGCFGGENDRDPWVQETLGHLENIDHIKELDLEFAARKENPIKVVKSLLQFVNQQTVNTDIWEDFGRALAAAKEQLMLDAPIIGATSPLHWQLDGQGKIKVVPNLAAKEAIESACQQGGESCNKEVVYVKTLFRVAVLTESALTYHNFPVIKMAAERYTIRKKMWDAYKLQALPQYWWEWALNGRMMRANDKRPKDASGDRMGPPAIPNSQFIFLHPSVGFEGIDLETGGSETDAVLYLEFLGYNRWSWDKTTGAMKAGFGASIIGSVADREKANDFRYGIMFHLGNKFSVAVTHHDGDTGFLVGLDLAEFFRGKMKKIIDLKEKGIINTPMPW